MKKFDKCKIIGIYILAVILMTVLFVKSVSAEQFNVSKYLSKSYVTVGIGYKLEETSLTFKDGNMSSPVSARLEMGIKDGNITYGISHHSQWFTGFPFNNDMEYGKTEIFIDYKFQLGELLK